MENALYHQQGYYQRKRMKIGKEGDFYTSSSVHPVFAWVFADYFVAYCESNDVPLHICELGGGKGDFAKQVLDYLRETSPDRYKRLKYMFVDVSKDHIEVAKSTLREHENVSYFESIEDFERMDANFKGVIFSNELLDAFPVHVVMKNNGQLFEVMITVDDHDQLKEITEPLHNEQVRVWIHDYKVDIPEGHRIEVPLIMDSWLKQMSNLLCEGALVTVDYGYTKEEFQDPALKNGTLRGYYKHQMVTDPLHHAGEMDLTVHIPFDALIQKGNEVGLEYVTLQRQRDFLVDHGLFNHLIDHQQPDPFSKESKLNRAIRSFATPGGISDAFRVLIQQKNTGNIK
ncbi:class I SAM-dependent methyltransferase [Pseudalkalibacillus berkeleyi]|uniref:SAM-dependent methyltransferase n=1 Tax=Pseudalkalibacillus berkeleyi TaxID=1069813 RepID=A0ABS9H1I1_9BACL|nr:SAM-dependent methyltransferase [Pseudalkalibacillus berkeleyi]MCF6137891.1 SAM-dependent methyltransferase [Pseudalkalibacillus berkeleyi]